MKPCKMIAGLMLRIVLLGAAFQVATMIYSECM